MPAIVTVHNREGGFLNPSCYSCIYVSYKCQLVMLLPKMPLGFRFYASRKAGQEEVGGF